MLKKYSSFGNFRMDQEVKSFTASILVNYKFQKVKKTVDMIDEKFEVNYV